jgi:hypothetical protein
VSPVKYELGFYIPGDDILYRYDASSDDSSGRGCSVSVP